ncbi:hypothetical protein CK507_04540 [Pseudomonas sp. WN033]|nr:hypothetical protein CK507_04540 [Pseudomonas sp. WN033]
MNLNSIFLPVIVQILLTLWLYILINLRKQQAASQGQVNESRRGLFDDAWPESVIKVNNCIRNQFEVPVLFYVLCITLWVLNAVGWLALACAWLFVASRIAHAIVHTGSNIIPVRRRLFMIGTILVLIMTILLLLRLLGLY